MKRIAIRSSLGGASLLALVLAGVPDAAGAQELDASRTGNLGLMGKVRLAMGLAPQRAAPMMLLPTPNEALTAPPDTSAARANVGLRANAALTSRKPSGQSGRRAAPAGSPTTRAEPAVLRSDGATPQIAAVRASTDARPLPRAAPRNRIAVGRAEPVAGERTEPRTAREGTRPQQPAVTPRPPAMVPRPHPMRSVLIGSVAAGVAAASITDEALSDQGPAIPPQPDEATSSVASTADASEPVAPLNSSPVAADDAAQLDPTAAAAPERAEPASETPSDNSSAEPSAAGPAVQIARAAPDAAPLDATPRRALPNPASTTDEQMASDADARAAERMRGSTLPQLMRQMSALQDAIALGSTTALAAQRVITKRVATAVQATPPEVLVEPENADALLVYALTGGTPNVVRGAVGSATYPAPYGALLSGALAFLEGRQADARRHFAPIDPVGLGDVAQGPVRLALAALAVEEDPLAALDHLDRARVAAPGTLIEEAALRRSVLIAAELNDVERFQALANRYLRKFRNSVYAGNFRRRLSGALTRMEFLTTPDGFDALEAILAPMPVEGRRELYLNLARTAVEAGRSEIAERAALMSKEGVSEDSLDQRRAALYVAAAQVVSPTLGDDARRALLALDPAPLPEADRALRLAAIELGDAVATLPPRARFQDFAGQGFEGQGIADQGIAGRDLAGNALTGPRDPADTTTAPPAEDVPELAVESRFKATIAEVDALLRSSQ